MAKLVDIKVHEFSIGMGPKLAQVKKGETAYSIRALPLGGYVRMEGEDEASDDLRSYNNKSVLSRIAVIFAGPFMNFVLAICLFSIIFYYIGTPTTRIDEVIPQSPAQDIGIRSGDIIHSIDGKRMDTWQDVIDAIGNSDENPIDIVIIRDGNKMEKTVRATRDADTDRITIGIVAAMKKSVFLSVQNGFIMIKDITIDVLTFLKGLVTGGSNVSGGHGPYRDFKLGGRSSKTGWLDIVNLTAVLSEFRFNKFTSDTCIGRSRIMFLLAEVLRGNR